MNFVFTPPVDPKARQEAAFRLAERLMASCVEDLLAEEAAKRLLPKQGEAFTTGDDALETRAVRSEEEDRGAA
jgi:hypothetical protein